ncbi:Short-chain dehydrogenase TIC 32- chloroplastic [Apiospora saccharicola]|uniref:Short-chain dehydrogenase TIC 32- chloroplastic n=1 Tax=Apiospora saccharicola TaxID=335842 RepID=A0ABR1TNU1_9PEZI
MKSSKGSIIMTGTNGGLGCAIVRRITSTPELVRYHGIYLVRDATQAIAFKSLLASAPPSHSYEIISLELCRLADGREVARGLKSRIAAGEIPPIRALLLVAGYTDAGLQLWTDEGFDVAFVSNYLGHWLLTMMLLETSNTLPTPLTDKKWKLFFCDDNLDAIVHGTWSSNDDPTSLARQAGTRRYGVANMCNVMMIAELQRRLDADPVLHKLSVVGVDPAVMGTGLLRRGNFIVSVLMWPIIIPLLAPLLTWLWPNGEIRTTYKSAGDVLAAAFEAGDRLRGQFLNGSEIMTVMPEAAGSRKRRMVWRDSVRYARLEEKNTALAQWK